MTMDISYIQIDLMRYVEDNASVPSEDYQHSVISVIQQSVSDNRIQCDVFYSKELETCKNTAHILESQYESAGYYAFVICLDRKIVCSSDNLLNLNEQNKSFRYFIET